MNDKCSSKYFAQCAYCTQDLFCVFVSEEPPEPETGFALHCNEDVLEEDEFRSLWSTATSFIFLFLFSLTYSAVLSLFTVRLV